MPFPEGWPPIQGTYRSLRFFRTGTVTTAFADNAWLFPPQTDPLPYVKPGSTASVAIGNQTLRTGVPMGGGRNPNDINPTTSDPTKQPPPVPTGVSRGIYIANDDITNVVEFSFDGAVVHGVLQPSTSITFTDLYMAGICVRGPILLPVAPTFRVIAW